MEAKKESGGANEIKAAVPPNPDPGLVWSMVCATVALLVVVGLVVVIFNSPTGAQATVLQLSATSALALIGAVAVVIERIIEGFWIFMGFAVNSWWPLKEIPKRINTFVTESNIALGIYHAEARDFIEHIGNKLDKANDEFVRVQKKLAELPVDTKMPDAERIKAKLQLEQAWEELRGLQAVQARSNEISNVLKNLPTESHEGVRTTQDVRLTATRITGTIDTLRNLLPQLETQATLAQQSVSVLSNFVETFKDNPARRLISIYIGAFFGLGAAASFQLDLFQAILNPDHPVTGVGIAMTGLVIGLGVNPTHEVIRLLEEFKKSQKAQNTDSSSNA